MPLKHMLGTNQPKLQEIVALMKANLDKPIDLDELVGMRVGVAPAARAPVPEVPALLAVALLPEAA